MKLIYILTDDRLVALVGTVFGILTVGLGVAGKWIFNKIIEETKTARTATNEQIQEFTQALNHKFKALNYFAKEADKKIIQHQESLKTLNNESDHQKKNLKKLSGLQLNTVLK